MLPGLDHSPDTQKSNTSSQAYGDEVDEHGLEEFCPGHNGEAQDRRNRYEIAECRVLLRHRLCLKEGDCYRGWKRSSSTNFSLITKASSTRSGKRLT